MWHERIGLFRIHIGSLRAGKLGFKYFCSLTSKRRRGTQSGLGKLLPLGKDLHEHVLENLYERQVKTSTLMRHAMTLDQQDIVSENGAEKPPKVEDDGQ